MHNVNAPGENFGSHRGRFFVFLSDFQSRCHSPKGCVTQDASSARGLGQTASTSVLAVWVPVGIACRLVFMPLLCHFHTSIARTIINHLRSLSAGLFLPTGTLIFILTYMILPPYPIKYVAVRPLIYSSSSSSSSSGLHAEPSLIYSSWLSTYQ